MKDIENPKLVHVQDALQRLDLAVAHLESVAAKAKAASAVNGDAAALREKLAHLDRAHGALKETAGRVATRLDTAISRLATGLKD